MGYARKDAKLSLSVDRDAARVLATIADREAEGNQSLALRMLLREAGARRGLFVAAPHPQPMREVQHAS